MIALLLLLGCGSPDEETVKGADTGSAAVVDECDDAGSSELVVIQSLWFEREVDGISLGFDLDGVQGPGACGVDEYVGPNGEEGIDNAFASLLPALELTEAQAIEDIIASAIASGQLLVSLELDELDDTTEDECVDLTVGRATGDALLGTDGLLLSGQTFDRDVAGAGFEANAPMIDGTLEAREVTLDLPIEIFGISLVFELLDGAIRVQRLADGRVLGQIAGGVDINYILGVAQEDNVDPALLPVLDLLLHNAADLQDEAGECTRISITLGFEAVPAFWYPDSP